MTIRLAIDVGGTFTDLCALNELTGEITIVKDSTTPSNYAEGVVNVLRRSGIRGQSIDRFIGTGSTMVINALTEKRGAKTLLVTTKGFRDVLEIQRSNRTDLYNLRYEKPKPFVPRYLRYEVDERVSSDGEIVRPLKREDVLRVAEACKREKVEAVAIALYNSYANPEHELECKEILGKELGKVYVTMSHEMTREWREYERTSTAVMNAFVHPKVDLYLSTLEGELRRLGIPIRPHVMQSNGGVSTFEEGRKTPIYQVESGPIGGTIGAQTVGRAVGVDNIITLDVGGTTAKTSLLPSGKLEVTTEYHLGRTDFFPGYPVKAPVMNIVEIGAGGGSIVWIDDVGALKVGPRSAGADPGPACYGKGGKEPTLTDALVLTGVIDPAYFLGGEIRLKPELSERAFVTLARRLRMSPREAAMGAIRLATANMVNAMKLISVRRGYDPRDFSLVAFGGGGPIFAVAIARELGLGSVIVPRGPGVFSAWGMLMTDLRHDYIQTKVVKYSLDSMKGLQEIIDRMIEKGYAQLGDEGVSKAEVRFEASFDIRYAGQEHTVTTPVPLRVLGEQAMRLVAKRFNDLHHKQYTFTLTDPLEIVNVHLSAFGKVKKPRMRDWKGGERGGGGGKGLRTVFIEGRGFKKVPVYERDSLRAGSAVEGPAIIEEATSTTILGGGDQAKIDRFGNVVVEVG